MKFPILSTIAVVACALVATARAELRVASFNMEQALKQYHKHTEAEKALNQELEAIKKEAAVQEVEIKALIEQHNKLVEQLKTAPTDAAREQLQKAIVAKRQEVEARNRQRQEQQQKAMHDMQKKMKQVLLSLIAEVEAEVDKMARSAGYDMVIDTSFKAPQGNRAFPYVKASHDITQKLVKRLNAASRK